MANRAYRALALYQLGYPDQAVRASRENVALAQEIGRLSALTVALFLASALHQVLGDAEVARERTEALIALATEHGFYQYVVSGMLLRGYALATGGQIEAGITEMRGGLYVLRAAGAELARPCYTGLLAEAYGKVGQPAQGIALIEEAVECMNRTGQRLVEAELQRIMGELLIADYGMRNAESGKENLQSEIRNLQSEAEDCFRHAIDCARRQRRHSPFLRSLHRQTQPHP